MHTHKWSPKHFQTKAKQMAYIHESKSYYITKTSPLKCISKMQNLWFASNTICTCTYIYKSHLKPFQSNAKCIWIQDCPDWGEAGTKYWGPEVEGAWTGDHPGGQQQCISPSPSPFPGYRLLRLSHHWFFPFLSPPPPPLLPGCCLHRYLIRCAAWAPPAGPASSEAPTLHSVSWRKLHLLPAL